MLGLKVRRLCSFATSWCQRSWALNNSFVVASCDPATSSSPTFGLDKRWRATREKESNLSQRPKPRRPTRRAAPGFRALL